MRRFRIRLRRDARASRLARRLVGAGFVGGVLAGLLVWSVQMRRSRRDLFSRNPVKRLAALGHLGGRADTDLEAVHLLTEYVTWEREPLLRRRAERLLQRRKQRFM